MFTPAPRGNPVLAALKAQETYGTPLGDGRHAVVCPWAHEHQGEALEHAIYVEPTLATPFGQFHCQHHDEDNRKGTHDFLNRTGVEPSEARCKPRICLRSGEQHLVLGAAEHVLASQPDYFQSNKAIASIGWDPVRNDVSVQLVNEQALAIALSAAADWEKYDGRSKSLVPCDPPVRTIQMLAKAPEYKHLRVLNGIARQPYFRATDRKLISKPGYDPESGIYASFNASAFAIPALTREAAEKSLARLLKLVEEMHFASEVDRATAVSAMLTAAVRSTLRLAPAFNITAASSGSGKSYAAEVIGQFASAGHPLVMSYPANSEEASKAMLAAFLQAPAAILFDDMQTDWLPFGVMNRMLTSEWISERILGSSRVVTASTNGFIMGTGNNVGPVRDLSRRVATIRLEAPSSNPATLRYFGDPVGEMRRNRESYVCDALTIIGAWREAGCPTTDVPPIGSFGEWSDACRQPLLWLGLPDPATSLIEQVNDDPDTKALGVFILAWSHEIGPEPVSVRKLLAKMHKNPDSPLAEAVLDLPVMERGMVNPSKLGRHLKRNARRVFNGYRIVRVDASDRTAWSVQPEDGNALRAPAPAPLKLKLPDGTEMINGEIF